MPRPIKRKVARKTSAEEDVMNTYEKVAGYYKDNSRNVNFFLLIAAVVIVAAVLVYASVQRSIKAYSEATTDAYRVYVDAVSQDREELYNEALLSIKKAKDKKGSALLEYYESDLYDKKGDLAAAINSLESLVKEYANDDMVAPLAYTKLAMLYRKKGDMENASRVFAQLENSDYPALRDLAMYYQSKLQERMGNNEEAGRIKGKLLEMYPASPYAVEIKAIMEREEAAKNKEKADAGGKDKDSE